MECIYVDDVPEEKQEHDPKHAKIPAGVVDEIDALLSNMNKSQERKETASSVARTRRAAVSTGLYVSCNFACEHVGLESHLYF
jgi:hypothetical protein